MAIGNGSRVNLAGELARQRQLFEARGNIIHAGQEISSFATLSVQSAIAAIIKTVDSDTRNYLKGYAQLTGASITRNRETRLKNLHTDLAEDALDAIEKAYLSHFDKGTHSSNYRQMSGADGRYSGGKLLTALTAPEMYSATRDGVAIINPLWLDSQAKQWYRMNYGAGAKGKNTPKGPGAQQVVIFGQQSPIDSGLNNFGPSPSYFLPPGYWREQGTGKAFGNDRSRLRFKDEFYLLGGSKFAGGRQPKVSLGFAGSRFLDAGVARLIQTTPQAYDRLIVEWFNEYTNTAGGPFAHESVRITDARAARLASDAQKRLNAAEQLILQRIN